MCGPDKRRGATKSKKQRVISICLDVIFAAAAGKRKPSKYLVLVIVIKSLTGSKKAIDILNRLGHTVCYSTVAELETEMTFGEVNRVETTPVGMNRSPNVATGDAFDNFDRFVETLSGKNTLQDTVGIAYRTCTIDILVAEGSSNTSSKENDV